MIASGDVVDTATRWLLANRWFALAIALLVVIAIGRLLRDRTPPDDGDAGEPPPAGGVA